MKPKTRCRLYKITACITIWIAYTYMIVQLFKLDVKSTESKKLDFTQETYEVDQRASVCFKDIIPFSTPLIQGSRICQNKPDLLIVVHTDPDSFKIRNIFRNEFAIRITNTSTRYDFKVDTIYLIGLNERYCILAETVTEIVTYGDILVGSFIDSYYNQTLKSITMLEWFVKHCKSAMVMLKIDHRMDPMKSLDNEEFYNSIRNVKNQDKIILGSTNDVEITSQRQIPWISQPYLYPGLPRNLHLNYLLSRDSAESLLKAYMDTIYISVWKEDLYITGILASIAKLKITHNENFLLKCANTVCMFCACAWSAPKKANKHDLTGPIETKSYIVPVTSTEKSKDQHLVTKRDTLSTFQVYSSPPITTNIDNRWQSSTTVNFNTNLYYDPTTTHTTIDGMTTQFTTTQRTHIPTVTSHTTQVTKQPTEFTTASTKEETTTSTEIIDVISITDIPIFQIDEFELGFEAAAGDKYLLNYYNIYPIDSESGRTAESTIATTPNESYETGDSNESTTSTNFDTELNTTAQTTREYPSTYNSVMETTRSTTEGIESSSTLEYFTIEAISNTDEETSSTY